MCLFGDWRVSGSFGFFSFLSLFVDGFLPLRALHCNCDVFSATVDARLCSCCAFCLSAICCATAWAYFICVLFWAKSCNVVFYSVTFHAGSDVDVGVLFNAVVGNLHREHFDFMLLSFRGFACFCEWYLEGVGVGKFINLTNLFYPFVISSTHSLCCRIYSLIFSSLFMKI